MTKFFFLAAAAVLSFAATANAQLLFDEATGVEGSGDPLNPTALGIFSGGVFEVSGSSVLGPDGAGAGTLTDTTRDLFGFTIASGFQLDSIEVTELTQTLNVNGDLDPGFFFLDSGTTTAIPGGGFTPITGALIGVGPLASGGVGADLLSLDNITVTPGPAAGPQGAGDFVFGIQQTGPEELSYTIAFNVSAVAVPEPSSMALLSLAAFGLTGMRRRRK